MKQKKYFFLAICIALLSLCSLWFFRVIPISRMWDAYNIVFIDIDCEIDTVRTYFLDAQIEGVLYPNHENFPVSSYLAPVQYNTVFSDFTYEQLQNLYFFDRDKNYHLYYVPAEHEKSVKNALKNLPYVWGIDSETTIPFIPPLVTLIFSVVLICFCKNKLFFGSVQLPFVFYCVAVPFYHIASFVCLWGYAVFILERYWKRRFFFEQLLKHIFLLSSFVLLLAVSIVSGVRVFLLFFATLLLLVSLVYITMYLKRFVDPKCIFNPVLIHSAKTISTSNILNFRFALIPTLCVICLALLGFMNIPPYIENSLGVLYIPSPSEYTVKDDFSGQSYEQVIQAEEINRLPDLTDFVSAAWHMDTYPYIKLDVPERSVALLGESIAYNTYVKNGYALEEQIVILATFDDNYISQMLSTVLNNTNAGAEKLLASQNGFLRVRYNDADSGSYESQKGSTVFLICACVYILGLLVQLKIKRRY